jgi:hypothetical protein
LPLGFWSHHRFRLGKTRVELIPGILRSAVQFGFPSVNGTPYHRDMALLLPLPAAILLDPASVLAGLALGIAVGLAVGVLTRGRGAV